MFVTDAGELVVVDLKTGSRTPESDMQLGFYAAGLELMFGVRPHLGAYWMARKGGLTPLVDLDRYTPEFIGKMLDKFNLAVEHEIFLPHATSLCGSCGVRPLCPLFEEKTHV